MSAIRVETIIQDVNAKVGGEALAHLLDYHVDRIQITGNAIKSFCPLHEEQAFRSLVIDLKTRTFHCTMKRCVGFQGGSLVSLWAAHMKLEPLEAALDLAEKLELDIDVASLRSLGTETAHKARAALEKGDLDEARQAAEQAVAFLPRDVATGQIAIEIYSKSQDEDRLVEESLRVGALCIELKDFATAHELVDPLMRSAQDNLDLALFNVALAKAEGVEEGLAHALIGLAKTYAARGDQAGETQCIEEVVKVGADLPEVLESAADMHDGAGREAAQIEILCRLSDLYETREAWAQLQNVLERREALAPDDIALREKKGQVVLKTGDGESAAQIFVDLARHHQDQGDNDRARETLQYLLQEQPNNLEALEQLATWSVTSGHAADAVKYYRDLAAQARQSGDPNRSTQYLAKAKEVDPDDYGLRYDLAEAQLTDNNQEGAIAEFFELANLYINESDPTKGIEILDRIREMAPDDVSRHIDVGRCLEATGYEDKALECYLELIERLQTGNKAEDALRVCDEAAHLAPRDEKLMELRVEANLKLGRKAEAIEVCREVAKSYQAVAEFETAERLLNQGIKIDRTEPSIKTDMAHLYELMGRTHDAVELWIEVALFHKVSEDGEKALQAAREAVRLKPDNEEAMGLVAEGLEAQGRAAAALELWKSATDQLLAKNPNSPEALPILEHALELKPNDVPMLSRVAQLKFNVEGAESARPAFRSWLESAERFTGSSELLQAYRTSVENYPEDLTWRSRLTDLMINHGFKEDAVPHVDHLLAGYRKNPDKAEEYLRTLEKAVKLSPERLEVRLELAEHLAESGQVDQASAIFSDVARQYLSDDDSDRGLAALQRLLHYQPENSGLLLRVAELLEDKSRVEESIKLYAKLIGINFKEGRDGANLPIFKKLVVLEPERLDHRERLGELYEKQNEIDLAVEQYLHLAKINFETAPKDRATLALCEKVVSLAPDVHEGRELLVQCYLKRKELGRAKEELAQMGDIALRDHDQRQAEIIFQRIHDIDPNDIGNTERLGKLYEAKGQIDQAEKAYRSVMGLYEKEGNEPKAVGTLRKLCGLAPEDLDLRVTLARRLTKLPEQVMEAADEWYDVIRLAVKHDQGDAARSAMEESADLLAQQWDRRLELAEMLADVLEESECLQTWKTLAIDALKADRDQVAYEAASEGIGLAPSEVDLRELRIDASRRLSKWEAARSDLKVLADQCIKDNKRAKAEHYLSRAIEIDPQDHEMIEELAQCQLDQGHESEAISTLRHLSEQYRDQGELQSAIAQAERIIGLQASDVEAKDYLAALLIDDDQIETAMDIWREIGESLSAEGQIEVAFSRFEGIVGHQERDRHALRRVAELSRALHGEEASLARYERLIDVLIEDCDRAEVEAEFREILSDRPEPLVLAEKFADYLHSIGQDADAVAELKRISAVFRDERSQPDEALRVLETLREIDPDNLEVLGEEAAILQSIGQPDKAVQKLRDLSSAYDDEGNPTASAGALARAADVLRDDIEIQVEVAEVYEGLNEVAKATVYYLRAIEIYEGREDLAACIPLLKRAIAINPARLELGEALGQVYEKTGQTAESVSHWLELGSNYESYAKPDRAIEIYERVKKLAPEEMESRGRLARIAEADGRTDVALTELREMIPIAMSQGDPDDAISILTHVLELDPDDVSVLEALADLYRKHDRGDELYHTLCDLENYHRRDGDVAGALKTLEDLKALRPDEPQLLVRTFELLGEDQQLTEAAAVGQSLTNLYFEMAEIDQAVAMMRRVIEIDPNNVDQIVRLLELGDEQGYSEIVLDEFLRLAADQTERKKWAACVKMCTAAVKLFAEEPEPHRWLIKALQASGKDERAAAEQLHLVELHESQGDAKQAELVLEEILAGAPDHEAAHSAIVRIAQADNDTDRVVEHLIRLAEIHYVAGNLKKSISDLETLLGISPDHRELRSRLAELYHEAGDTKSACEVWAAAADELYTAENFGEAVKIYERLKSFNPSDVDLIERLTNCYRDSGDDPNYLQQGIELGEAHIGRGAFGDAIHIYEQLSEHFPTEVRVWERLAEAYGHAEEPAGQVRCLKYLYELFQNTKRFDRAKASLEKALELCPNDTELLQRLGELCLKLNQKAKALTHLSAAADQLRQADRLTESREIVDRILKIDPTNVETRRTLATLCDAMGDLEGAILNYSTAARGQAEKRNNAEAIELFEIVLRLDPSLRSERETFARVLEREGKIQQACEQHLTLIHTLEPEADTKQTIRYCRQILKSDPDHLEAHAHLYRVYESTQKRKLALKECQWIADRYLSMGEGDHAEEYIRRGLELAPEDIALHKKLIDLLQEKGRSEDAGEALGELATLAQKQADSKTARWALERACEIDPNNVEHRMNLAEQQERAGEVDEARSTRIEILQLHLENGEMEPARVIGEGVIQTAPHDEALRRRVAEIFKDAGLPEVAAYHYLELAKAALDAGRYDRVRELTDYILEIKPRHIAARRYLFDALSAEGATEEACEQSLELYRLHLDEKEYEDALHSLKFVIHHRPSDTATRRLLVDLYRLMGREEPMIEQMRRLAEDHISAGDIDGAIEALRGLMSERPDDTRARARYIDLYSQIGDETELLDDYIQLAGILRRKGALVEATQVFEKLLQRHPDHPECREQFIDFLFEQGQINRGVDESRKLAELYLKNTQTVESSKVLDRALLKSPDDVDLRHQLANLQMQTNRRGSALETLRGLYRHYDKSNDEVKLIGVLEKMLDIDDQNIDLLQRLADAYMHTGETAKARDLRVSLAEQYLTRDLFDLAEREYRRVLDISPADAEIWQRVIETHLHIGPPSEIYPDMLALADVYVGSGRLKDALSTYKQILEGEPNNVGVLRKYTEIYSQIGLEQDLADEYLHLATLLSQSGEVEESLKIFDHLREIAANDDKIGKRLRESGLMNEAGQPPSASTGQNGPDKDLADFIDSPAPTPSGSEDQVRRAIRNYQNILKLNPDNPTVRSKLAEMIFKTGQIGEADREWAQAAKEYFERGEFDQSIQIYQDLVERSPQDQRLRERLSRATLKKEAVNALESVIEEPE